MTSISRTIRPPIAVVGVSALFPGSVDSTGFWTDILAGTDRMTDVPPTHWLIDDHYDADPSVPDKTYGRRGGFLEPIDFDAMGFGVPPSVVSSTDTAQLLALIVAQRVLDDAMRGQFTELDRSRASVILGVTSGQELLGAMASRMNRPMWLQGMRRAGIAEDVGRRRHATEFSPCTRSGPRARSPACSATSWRAGSPTASISAGRTASPMRHVPRRSRRSRWGSTSSTSATATW